MILKKTIEYITMVPADMKEKKPRFHLTQGEVYTSRYGNLEIKLRFEQNRGEATRFRIIGPDGNNRQAVFIPKSQTHDLDKLDWFWRKYDARHKLELAGYPVGSTCS